MQLRVVITLEIPPSGVLKALYVALQSISQSSMAPGTVQTASVGDNQPGVTNLSTGAAKYDASIQKLTIPGINFNLSCPTGLRVSWTSGQISAQSQQPVNGQQGEWPVIALY